MTTTDDAADLRKPYEPAMLYLPDARVAEYVTRDGACLYEEIGDGAALVRDMRTREVIGFRIEDPKAWAERVVRT